jgi:heavy metal sensor kinase
MSETTRQVFTGFPIRIRLTLWYVLLMGLTFALLGSYIFFRIQRSLVDSIDIALHIAVSQIILSDEDIGVELVFDEEARQGNIGQSNSTNFALRLVSPEGVVLDAIGPVENLPVWEPVREGFSTSTISGDDDQWRFYSEPVIRGDGEVAGWVQGAQSLETVTDALEDFRDQLLWGIPVVLTLAGIGGYFLADRALRPIDRITRTAQRIEAEDLSRRIGYKGPADEIGRLAMTFDQMLERLEVAFAGERRFTEDAAHELRTPLTALKGQMEVALNQPRRQAEYEKILRDLTVQVDRLIRLSNALLFLSHSDRNRLSGEVVILNLGDLLESIVDEIQPLANAKDLKLNARIPAELTVYGDPEYLIRLFLNLFDNAVKYTPIGGQILIQASSDGNTAEITIFNSGPGIPPEHLPHVFDRFYRVDTDRSSETGGSGLGLAITREIVRMHGGDIQVKSEVGQGTTFTIHLPRSTDHRLAPSTKGDRESEF